MQIRRSIAVAAVVIFCSTAGCSEAPEPSYLRIDGPAPVDAGLPATRSLLVVFWASWCEPCVREAPSLLKLAADPLPGLDMVLYSHDTDLAPAENAFGEGARAPLALRADFSKATAGAFGAGELPVAFLLVDRRFVARFEGPRDWNSPGMRRLLARLVGEHVDEAD